MSKRYPCPICGTAERIPYRAVCVECFDWLPWEECARYMHAWRHRITNPPAYQERLAVAIERVRERKGMHR